MPVAAHIPLASKGSFLISTNVGIMIWTVVVFVISMLILRRAVFPRIGEALDNRAKVIAGDIDAAQETREKAEEVLDEYRERLKEARAQSDEIVARARQTAEVHEKEAKESIQVPLPRQILGVRRKREPVHEGSQRPFVRPIHQRIKRTVSAKSGLSNRARKNRK